MELILLILGALSAISATIVVVFILIITIANIADWFRSRQVILQASKDKIAFTLKEKIQTGKYKLVQGIFDKNTTEIDDARVIEHEHLDEEMSSYHAVDELAIYEN